MAIGIIFIVLAAFIIVRMLVGAQGKQKEGGELSGTRKSPADNAAAPGADPHLWSGDPAASHLIHHNNSGDLHGHPHHPHSTHDHHGHQHHEQHDLHGHHTTHGGWESSSSNGGGDSGGNDFGSGSSGDFGGGGDSGGGDSGGGASSD